MKKSEQIISIILSICILVAFAFQVEAMFEYSNFKHSIAESPQIIPCFIDLYSGRMMVELLCFGGALLSCLMIYKRRWKIFKSIPLTLLVISPVLIYILHRVIIQAIWY